MGAGPAGVAAALAARRSPGQPRVVLVAEENLTPYEKPPLSKDVLAGIAEPGSKPIVDSHTLETEVEFVRADPAIAIDRRQRVVHLKSGATRAYDALVLAMGARARVLPVLAPDVPNVHYLRTAADALALRSSLQAGQKRLVVVGAGLIGLEVASVATGRAVTVIEAGATAMSRVCSAGFARLVVERHAKAGIRFLFGATIASACCIGNAIALRLGDGTVIETDLVVLGVGSKPAIELAAAAGLEVGEGILVDEACRTSDPVVFAAGDVAQFRTPWCSEPTRLENWRHALDHGQVAGINAAGGKASYGAAPSFWSDQRDLKIQGVGWPDGLGVAPVRRIADGARLIEFHLRDECIRYAVGLGVPRELGIVRRLIERKIRVTPQMLSDPAFSLQGLLRP